MSLTNGDGTPQIVRYVDEHGIDRISSDPNALIRYASQALRFGEHGLFELLPAAIDRIIEKKVWLQRDPPLKDFGQLALHPTGLGIKNDRGLALLRAAMEIKGRHIGPWTDVLAAVEQAVKAFMVEAEQSVGYIRNHPEEFKEHITYLPSSSSYDHRLLDLRRKDAVVFRQVASGKKPIREALARHTKVSRLSRMKSAWQGASEDERREFLAWLKKEC